MRLDMNRQAQIILTFLLFCYVAMFFIVRDCLSYLIGSVIMYMMSSVVMNKMELEIKMSKGIN